MKPGHRDLLLPAVENAYPSVLQDVDSKIYGEKPIPGAASLHYEYYNRYSAHVRLTVLFLNLAPYPEPPALGG